MSAHGDYSESRFESESILPSQVFPRRNQNEALEPIKRLMLAVLSDAVHCYQARPVAPSLSGSLLNNNSTPLVQGYIYSS
jgi:hypothetical protein